MSAPRDTRKELLDGLGKSAADGSFLRLVLGKPTETAGAVKRVTIRPVVLKAGLRWQVTRRTERQETMENPAPEVAQALAAELLGTSFLSALLETKTAAWQLELWPDRPGKLTRRTTAEAPEVVAPVSAHDRPKANSLDFSAPWWRELGVTDERGQVRPGMAAKQGQIQKFAELLRHDLAAAVLPEGTLRLADLGSGKGYLTFAAWEVLASAGRPVEVTGVELRPELAAACARAAQSAGCEGLRFAAGGIADTPLAEGTMVTALHACDTATDDALVRALAATSPLILAAPCCHREVRPQLRPPSELAGMLDHGIQCERMSESLTDALRALALSASGYRTRVFEFISTEHTHKNVMISGVRLERPDAALCARSREEAGQLRRRFGIVRQSLWDSPELSQTP